MAEQSHQFRLIPCWSHCAAYQEFPEVKTVSLNIQYHIQSKAIKASLWDMSWQSGRNNVCPHWLHWLHSGEPSKRVFEGCVENDLACYNSSQIFLSLSSTANSLDRYLQTKHFKLMWGFCHFGMGSTIPSLCNNSFNNICLYQIYYFSLEEVDKAFGFVCIHICTFDVVLPLGLKGSLRISSYQRIEFTHIFFPGNLF